MTEGSDTIIECPNCGNVWSRRGANECPDCGRPVDPDWDAPVERTEFEKRLGVTYDDG